MNPMSAAFSMVAGDAAKAAGVSGLDKVRGAFFEGRIAVRSDDRCKDVAVGAAAKSMLCPDTFKVLDIGGTETEIPYGIYPGEGESARCCRITVNRMWLLRILRVMDSDSVTLAFPPSGGGLRVGGTSSVRIAENGDRVEIPVAECIAPVMDDGPIWGVKR